jgi:hypothetical protein
MRTLHPAASRFDRIHELPERSAPASPSYVESILFGRRWLRAARPSVPADARDRTASEQERT